jgi:hypothetical protein
MPRTGRPKGIFNYFLSHVMEPSPNGCRLWGGRNTDQDGYGRFAIDKVEVRVNILTCEAWNGPKPFPEAQAAHRCGNTNCWAGEHLYWATPRQNTLDKWAHGTMPHGEAHHKAKLSEADVLSIRTRYESGEISLSDLAREHGVTQPTISAIVHRKTWTHI